MNGALKALTAVSFLIFTILGWHVIQTTNNTAQLKKEGLQSSSQPASTSSQTSSFADYSDTSVDAPEIDYPDYPAEDESTNNCNPNYSPCIPDSPYDLDCADIGESVRVIGSDEYRLDRDSDGMGCESYN